VFSIVFFAQFIIGLLGESRFLMTGKLHIPVPAVIIAGPIYRGGGLFMPILFISTIVLVGPAWCSYLCYIGSWDHAASLTKRKPGILPSWRKPLRIAILVLVPIMAIILRVFGVSTTYAALMAIAFGLLGACLMIFWSRRAGLMAHCITWCPMGLLTNWLGKLSPFRIRINHACNDCGACTFACRYEALTAADLTNRKPGLTCTLCGDCLKRCREDAIEYHFLKLKPATARSLFIVMVVAIHAVFMGLARI
jgi:polyferredoxin